VEHGVKEITDRKRKKKFSSSNETTHASPATARQQQPDAFTSDVYLPGNAFVFHLDWHLAENGGLAMIFSSSGNDVIGSSHAKQMLSSFVW
jgi:hypothetical protein